MPHRRHDPAASTPRRYCLSRQWMQGWDLMKKRYWRLVSDPWNLAHSEKCQGNLAAMMLMGMFQACPLVAFPSFGKADEVYEEHIGVRSRCSFLT